MNLRVLRISGVILQTFIQNLFHYNTLFADLNLFMPVFLGGTFTDRTVNKPAQSA